MQKDPRAELSEIVAELLDYGGILCSDEKPKVYIWHTVNGISSREEITSLIQLMDGFGPATYQIELSHPSIEGGDPLPYKVEYFSVEISYIGGGNWGRPHIQTVEEEIPPEYASGDKILLDKVRARDERLKTKIEGAMTILGLFADFYRAVSASTRRS